MTRTRRKRISKSIVPCHMKLSLVTLLRKSVVCLKPLDKFKDWCDDELVRLHKKSKEVYEGIPEWFGMGLVLKHNPKEDW